MSFSINIYPRNYSKVESINANVYGDGKGNCVILNIGDDTIILHYGESKCRCEFISKLKKVIFELPCETKCSVCGK